MKEADFEVFEPAAGFRVFVQPTTKFKTITLTLYVHQPLGPEATALALLPQVLRRGCRSLPDMRTLVTYLEDLFGASMGADVAKIGERQILVFRFEVVNDRFAPKKIHALEKSVQLLWKILSQPVTTKGGLRPDYVAQEKENLKRLIEGMINDRMSYAYERCIQEMCRGEAYARYEYGALEEIDPLTPKDLLKLHERLLREAPVDLFVSGDLDPKRVAAIARQTFRFGRRKIRPISPTVVRGGDGALREHVERLDVEQGKMVLGCRTGVRWGDPDTFALVVYNGVLGAFPHSKLFANVREREGLAYAVHSSVDHTKGLLFITAGIDPAKYTQCMEVIRRQMADLEAGKISDDEWEKTRLTLTDRIRSREDNPSAKIASFLEMSLNGKPLRAEEVIAGISAVTRADVVRAASRVKPDTIFYLTKPT